MRSFVCAILVMATLAVAAATTASVGPLISGAGTAAVVAALVLTVWNPPQPRVLPLTVLGVTAVSLTVTFAYQGPARSATANWWTAETLAFTALVAAAVRRPRPRTSVGLSLLLASAITLSPLRITLNMTPPAGHDETVQLCLLWALFAMSAGGIGAYLRSLDARSRAAVAAERQAQRMHLARDLHDYAAHDITAVVVLVEAARVMAEKDPRQALDLLPEIGAAGTQALEAMDRTVQLLAEPTAAGQPERAVRDSESARHLRIGSRSRRDLGELPSLVERFNRTGRPEAVLDMAEGLVDELPAEVSAVGYRVVVEALTNVRRHAGTASRVDISLRTAAGALSLQVSDDAHRPQAEPGLPERPAGTGSTGIKGLSARVAELGGELTAGPRQPHGWHVTVLLPLTGTPPAQETRASRNLPNG
ncbi:sensor histidine kinase [Streptomyces acidiscabies]|uniref:histidine kinase n=1 Tax=Streptomyces acidiscabies TaxID=42234 RepID=A0AAP6BFN2_9ACTN|nr:histidine kinase [Streptomyces acidiscabies]MBZ3914546.1 two-component sensor histidine kinase [Streptomyces acidiscabies]MDX2963881.1 histidine kinase [Streptomyces acidiscabies]MDX3017233.1 histidine kinase [Streptomyces acidiscabies]MDX3789184.1 histidine kinase [Streptomyces acidiscabies]